MNTDTPNPPTWNLNPAKNGIEIRFPRKPRQEILDLLTTQRFRFSWRKQLWYAKDTPDNRQFAIDLTQRPPTTPASIPTPKPRKRKPPKFLVVLAGKRKPKAVTKDGAR